MLTIMSRGVRTMVDGVERSADLRIAPTTCPARRTPLHTCPQLGGFSADGRVDVSHRDVRG